MGRRMGWVRTPRVAVGAMFLLAGSLFGTWASRIPAFVKHFCLSEDRLGLLLLCIALGAIIAFPFAGRLSYARRDCLTPVRLRVGSCRDSRPLL